MRTDSTGVRRSLSDLAQCINQVGYAGEPERSQNQKGPDPLISKFRWTIALGLHENVPTADWMRRYQVRRAPV
jgi:hypothetical protein